MSCDLQVKELHPVSLYVNLTDVWQHKPSSIISRPFTEFQRQDTTFLSAISVFLFFIFVFIYLFLFKSRLALNGLSTAA